MIYFQIVTDRQFTLCVDTLKCNHILLHDTIMLNKSIICVLSNSYKAKTLQ